MATMNKEPFGITEITSVDSAYFYHNEVDELAWRNTEEEAKKESIDNIVFKVFITNGIINKKEIDKRYYKLKIDDINNRLDDTNNKLEDTTARLNTLSKLVTCAVILIFIILIIIEFEIIIAH